MSFSLQLEIVQYTDVGNIQKISILYYSIFTFLLTVADLLMAVFRLSMQSVML